jgi:CrcB protein
VNELLLVGLLGGLGAVARFWLAKFEGALPWGILIANSVAAMIGATALTLQGSTNPTTVLLVSGLAGGLSTFSTLISQTSGYWLAGNWRKGWLNLALNVVVPSTIALGIGFVAVALLK